MKIVATLLDPDTGTIEMNGIDLIARKDETRRLLGYLPQEFGLSSLEILGPCRCQSKRSAVAEILLACGRYSVARTRAYLLHAEDNWEKSGQLTSIT